MAKISLAKFTPYTPIAAGVATQAAASQESKAGSVYMAKSIQAFNNLGNTLNSFGGVLNDIRKIELKRLESERLKLRKSAFKPMYGKGEMPKFAGFINDYIGRGAPKFWEALVNFFTALLKFAIIRPALKWLANPENHQKIKKVLETLASVFRWITNFLRGRIVNTINGLYDMLRDDATWWQRLTGFAKSFVNLGALFLGLRWLTNPVRLIKDVRWVLTTFYKSLTRFHKGLLRGRAGRLMGGKWGTAAKVVTAVAGTAYLGKKALELGDDDQPALVDGDLPQRAKGGWVTGPDSGYAVSTSPGKGSPEFIGHGTEYVAKKADGSSFVIPFNNFATRQMPGLTMANMQMAHAQGFDLPNSLPRLSGKEQFLGGVGSWFKNKFTDNKGISSLWHKPKQQKPMTFGQKFAAGNKGWQGRLGDWFKGGGAAQIGGSLFGNKGASIGGALTTLFGGGGSGEGGKATGWDIFKSIGGIASTFIKPGSKASNILGMAGGIGNMMFGPGGEGMSFGQKLGGLAQQFLGGTPVGGAISAIAGSGGLSGGIDSLGGGVGGGHSGGGSGNQGSGGMYQKKQGGGRMAVTATGKQILSKGYSVFNHPDFKNNKWKKGPPNRGGAHKPGGGQRHPKGGLYGLGLGLDAAWYGPGNKSAKANSLAGEMFGNRDGAKLTNIVSDGWGSWTEGGSKKGPGGYGYPGVVQLGFADRQVAGSGVMGMGEADYTRMKQAIIANAGDAGPEGMALAARSIFNQANAIDGGTGSTAFRGAKSMSDILGNLGIGSGKFSPNQLGKADEAIQMAFNTPAMGKMMTNLGLSEPYQALLLNSTTFKKGGSPFGIGSDPVGRFKNLTFAANDPKIGEIWKKSGIGDTESTRKQLDKENKGYVSPYERKHGKPHPNSSSARGAEMASPSSAGTGSILGASAKGTSSNIVSGKAGGNEQDRRESYHMKKIHRERARAQEGIMGRTQRLVQETMQQVESHNAGVRSSVAEAQAFVQKAMQGGGGQGGLASASMGSRNRIQSAMSLTLNTI